MLYFATITFLFHKNGRQDVVLHQQPVGSYLNLGQTIPAASCLSAPRDLTTPREKSLCSVLRHLEVL